MPIIPVPKRTIKAPTDVIRVATPSQEYLPKVPALVIANVDIKNRRLPTKTFGWAKGVLSLVKRKPADNKTNGKNIVVHERCETKKSFSLTKIIPCLAKETITKPAREKKNI
jgi:hypothetical protein